jgi:hypothetical protein
MTDVGRFITDVGCLIAEYGRLSPTSVVFGLCDDGHFFGQQGPPPLKQRSKPTYRALQCECIYREEGSSE